MCYEHDLGDTVKPDIVTLGKAISGGVTPVSGILANEKVMDVFGAGEHGSTFGGNPLAMAIAKAAVKAIVEEDMVGNSERLGKVMAKNLTEIAAASPLLKEYRSRGLFGAFEFHDGLKEGAATFSNVMLKHETLVRGVGSNPAVIRFAPALIVTESEINKACENIEKGIKELEAMN